MIGAGLLAYALAITPALAHPPIAEMPEAEEQAAFNADRADILAMAGNYKVRFDMQESTPWRAGYTPLERKISGGYESVRVIEDTGRRIVLQQERRPASVCPPLRRRSPPESGVADAV